MAQPKIRLHIGCGNDGLEQYLSIDIDSRSGADILLDVKDVSQLALQGRVEEVYLNHSIGYLRLWEARDFSSTVYGFLHAGGRFVIETVDLEKVIKKINSSIYDLPAILKAFGD